MHKLLWNFRHCNSSAQKYEGRPIVRGERGKGIFFKLKMLLASQIKTRTLQLRNENAFTCKEKRFTCQQKSS